MNVLRMSGGMAIVLAMTVSFFVSGCSDDKATKTVTLGASGSIQPLIAMPGLPVEIGFAQVSFPPYLRVTGLSGAESWGRWSESDKVVFKFGSNLPKRFAVVFSARAHGPNAGLAIQVKSGDQLKEMKLVEDKTLDVRLEFASEVGVDTIEVSIPKPTVPKNGDLRALGVAFTTMKIEPVL